MSGSHPPGVPQLITPVPYQHWLDDAANMGLMLYRMRNDSKRERIQRQHPSSGTPPRPSPLPIPDPPYATPRTAQALQTPTVATRSTEPSPTPPPPRVFNLPLD